MRPKHNHEYHYNHTSTNNALRFPSMPEQGWQRGASPCPRGGGGARKGQKRTLQAIQNTTTNSLLTVKLSVYDAVKT